MDTMTALPVFYSLSSPVRLDMFRLLVRAAPDGLVAGDIAAALKLAPNNASFHLRNLQQGGLVTVTAEGRFLRYRARIESIRELIDFLGAECCDGQPERCGLPVMTTCCPTSTETP